MNILHCIGNKLWSSAFLDKPVQPRNSSPSIHHQTPIYSWLNPAYPQITGLVSGNIEAGNPNDLMIVPPIQWHPRSSQNQRTWGTPMTKAPESPKKKIIQWPAMASNGQQWPSWTAPSGRWPPFGARPCTEDSAASPDHGAGTTDLRPWPALKMSRNDTAWKNIWWLKGGPQWLG